MVSTFSGKHISVEPPPPPTSAGSFPSVAVETVTMLVGLHGDALSSPFQGRSFSTLSMCTVCAKEKSRRKRTRFRPLSYLSGSDAPYTVRMDSKSHSLTRIRNLIPQHALIISLPTRTQISLLTRTHISRLIRTHISLPTRFPNLTSHTDS